LDPGDNTVQERDRSTNDIDPGMNLELTIDVPHPEQLKQRNATGEHDAAEKDVVARIFLYEKQGVIYVATVLAAAGRRIFHSNFCSH
ncbi:hypothetical protein S83_039084, partial [Arachis hypogaea]